MIALFTILQFQQVDRFPEAGTLALTMVALLLPFSSLWASAAIEEEISSLSLSHVEGFNSNPRRGSDTSYDPRNDCGSQVTQVTTQSTACHPASKRNQQIRTSSAFQNSNHERKVSVGQGFALGSDSRIENVPEVERRDSTDRDIERMGVRVDRSYEVRSKSGQ